MAQEMDDLLSKVDDTSFGECWATPYGSCYGHYLMDFWSIVLLYVYIFTVEDDWNVVFEECSPLASKWQPLSALLGLRLSIVDRIKSDFQGDSLGCLSEALKQWIKMNYNTQKYGKPSWKTLLKAIAKIDKPQFNRLATEHQGTGSTRYC